MTFALFPPDQHFELLSSYPFPNGVLLLKREHYFQESIYVTFDAIHLFNAVYVAAGYYY